MPVCPRDADNDGTERNVSLLWSREDEQTLPFVAADGPTVGATTLRTSLVTSGLK